VPAVAFVAMFVWLGLVFYADSHPGWHAKAAKPRSGRAPGEPASLPAADGAAQLAGPAGVSELDRAPGETQAGEKVHAA
jgi:hypothetical protein